MPRQNIQRQFVFGVFCPSRALMGASPSRISLSKIAFRDPKFEFFARRRPTMVGGAGGAFGALPNLQFPPLYTTFFFVARSARDNFHDFENSCEMPTLYRSHRLPPQKAYIIDMPPGMKKDKLADFYAGLESIKNGVTFIR